MEYSDSSSGEEDYELGWHRLKLFRCQKSLKHNFRPSSSSNSRKNEGIFNNSIKDEILNIDEAAKEDETERFAEKKV